MVVHYSGKYLICFHRILEGNFQKLMFLRLRLISSTSITFLYCFSYLKNLERLLEERLLLRRNFKLKLLSQTAHTKTADTITPDNPHITIHKLAKLSRDITRVLENSSSHDPFPQDHRPVGCVFR